jgi:hypothetical protein
VDPSNICICAYTAQSARYESVHSLTRVLFLLPCLSSSSRCRHSYDDSILTIGTTRIRVTTTPTNSTRRGLRRRRTRVTTIVPTRQRTAHLCPVNRQSTLRNSTRRRHSRGTRRTRIEPINPQRREVTLRRTFTSTKGSFPAINSPRANIRSPRSTIRLLRRPLHTAVAQEQEVALPDSPRRAAGPGRASFSARNRPCTPRPPGRPTTPAHHPRRLNRVLRNLAHRRRLFHLLGPSRPRNPFRHKLLQQQQETALQARRSTSPASIFRRKRYLPRRRKRSIPPLRLRNVRRDLAVVPSKTIQRSSTSPPRRFLDTHRRAWRPSNLGILRVRTTLLARGRRRLEAGDGNRGTFTRTPTSLDKAFLLRASTAKRPAANRQLSSHLVRTTRLVRTNRSRRQASMVRPSPPLPEPAPTPFHRTRP